MKKTKWLGYVLMVIVESAQLLAAPSFKEAEWSQNQIIKLSDLNDSVMQESFTEKMSDVIIECSEGARLPFKLTLKGQFLALEPAAMGSLYLKVLKTCYVRCDGTENLLFSTDLHTWEDFSEFFTGELKISVVTENGEPVADLQLELNQRKR